MGIEGVIVLVLFLCSFNEAFADIYCFFHACCGGWVITELWSGGSAFLV
jgi:hypothetical protein